MRGLRYLVAAALVVVGVLVLSGQTAGAQTVAPTPPPPQEGGGVTPQGGDGVTPQGVDGTLQTDSIVPSAIISHVVSNPYCVQTDPTVNQCSINIRYFQMTQDGTTSPFMAYAMISVDGKARYRSTVFFENTISYTYDMVPGGLKVACGTPNESGNGAAFGKSYQLIVAPYDINNMSLGTNIAPVLCPAYVP